jgi:hypothetical protein
MKWCIERDEQSARSLLSLVERVLQRLFFGPADLMRISR